MRWRMSLASMAVTMAAKGKVGLSGTKQSPRSAAEKKRATDSMLLFIGMAMWSAYFTPWANKRWEYWLTKRAISP